MENCTSGCIATKLLIMGVILVLVRMYTEWDIWIVIGGLLILKSIIMYIMPICRCNVDKKKKRK